MRGNFLRVAPRRFFANYKWRKEELSENCVTLLEKYDKHLRRKSFSPGGIYILHDNLAEKVMKFLCPLPENETAVVLEANPGPGILTRKILEAGVPNLRIFEPQPAFLHELRKLKEDYPRLEIFEENLFELSKITHRDQIIEGNLKTDAFLAGVKQSAWSDSPPLKIVGIPPPRHEAIFLRFIIARLGCLSSVFAYGRTQLLIFVSSKEHKTMTATPFSGFSLYRPASVFYNILFDVEVLEVFPRQLFYPPPHARRTDGYLYLVRLTPKINLLEDMGTHQRLQEFYFFVQQNMTKRTAPVIDTLEKWIPSCGPRVIGNGISIFTRFGDLEPQDILKLFLQFVSWPEYATCSFTYAVHKAAHDFAYLIAQSDEDE